MDETKIQYRVTWNEYGTLIDDLAHNLMAKLQKHMIKIDAIIVILREGAFTGIPLAYKLNTYKVIPIQFKYMLYEGKNELKQIAELPELHYELPENPVFLLCDTFPSGGKTKDLAIAKIKEKYPNAKFVFASLIQDKTIEDHPDVLCAAFAVDINDKWETTHQVYKNAGVTNVLYTLLPWENEAEELAGPNQTKWDYN